MRTTSCCSGWSSAGCRYIARICDSHAGAMTPAALRALHYYWCCTTAACVYRTIFIGSSAPSSLPPWDFRLWGMFIESMVMVVATHAFYSRTPALCHTVFRGCSFYVFNAPPPRPSAPLPLPPPDSLCVGFPSWLRSAVLL